MKKPNNNPKPQKMTSITSLQQLQTLVDSPLTCTFLLDSQPVEVKLKRVTAAIEEQRRAILRPIQPPWDDVRKEFNILAPKYLAAKEEAEKKARSLVVYTCCPIVAEQKPGLTTIEDIHKFVQSVLAEQLLELIAQTALSNGLQLEVQRLANFTHTPGSES
jgi:hypothetical protein